MNGLGSTLAGVFEGLQLGSEVFGAAALVAALLVIAVLSVAIVSMNRRVARARAANQKLSDAARADNAEVGRLRSRLAEIERTMDELKQAFASRLSERPEKPVAPPPEAVAAAAPAEAARQLAVIGVKDALFCRVYASTLANLGYESLRSQDGDEVLRWAAERKPAVLIVDLDLAVLEGGRGVKELRRRCPAAKILVLANDQTPVPPGADSVLSAPFGPLELARRLRQKAPEGVRQGVKQ